MPRDARSRSQGQGRHRAGRRPERDSRPIRLVLLARSAGEWQEARDLLAPVEVLDVADALLFRANALGQDKKERATQLRTLAIKVLGTSAQLRRAVIASRNGTTIKWYDFLLHSQLSSHGATRQIRSLAPRKHLLFFDFYHHVGNCQRHGPTRPDAGSVLPLRYPDSVRLGPPFSLPILEVPMARALSVISVRDLGCGQASGELAQLARSGGDPQLLCVSRDPPHYRGRPEVPWSAHWHNLGLHTWVLRSPITWAYDRPGWRSLSPRRQPLDILPTELLSPGRGPLTTVPATVSETPRRSQPASET
jgi:hypothetical protein